ncbi:hypothetical protein DL93DRAFT_2089618 [Clavulina sp. PMI_390]|nr:hypothetical protein DL93DRAFT_2089618 [Clavulina sp. PMI_390]
MPPSLDPYLDIPTYGVSGITFGDSPRKTRGVRLDYILTRASSGHQTHTMSCDHSSSQLSATSPNPLVRVEDAQRLGKDPIPHEVVKTMAHIDDSSMKVWPSDHLGVVATFSLGSPSI